jgi:orotate phosphoribosyltransferase
MGGAGPSNPIRERLIFPRTWDRGWHSGLVLDRQALIREVGEACRLTGQFTLRSGAVSTTYFDKYLFEADPLLLAEVARHAAALIPERTEVLAGLELGGVPVATAISLVTGIPTAFVRKQAKPYGTAKLAEGAEIASRRVLIVEDVVTTGGQVAMSTVELRNRGALVESVLCIIDRSRGVHAELDAICCSVISLLTAQELD